MGKKTEDWFVIRKWISFFALYLPYLLLLILLLLCFFCRPSAEDLAINYYSINPGIIGFIKLYYQKEGSRYFSFPLITMICHSRFVLEHYWIVPLSLMGLFWLVLNAAIKSFIHIIHLTVSPGWISWFSTILFLAFCSVIFEMSSFFYWMSGSVTYLPSFILFVLFALVLLQICFRGNQKTIYFPLLVLLVLCISGTNEIALYFLILFLIWIQLLYFSIERKFSGILLACLLTAFLCLIFLVLPSGVSHRAGNYRFRHPVSEAFIISAGYTVRIIFHAVSSAFTWIVMIFAVFAGCFTKEPIKKKIAERILLDPGILFPLICAAILFFYFMIYLFSGEMLAPRAQNLIMAFAFPVLLLCCYSYGLQLNNSFSAFEKFYNSGAVRLLLLFVLISSTFLHETIYNAVTGIIYNRVMKERTNSIQTALRNDRHSVVMHPYSDDFTDQVKRILPTSFNTIIRKKLMNYPDWMHFQDPVQDTALYIHYYAEYHHIDTIWFRGSDYKRIGLMLKENQK
jgi:hypothetical protein